MPVSLYFTVEELPAVDILAHDTIIITFEQPVVIDSAFFDVTNYDIGIVEGVGLIQVKEILSPIADAATLEGGRPLTTTYVILHTEPPTAGTHYRLTATGLTGTTGGTVAGSSEFIGRRTKTQSLIQSMPAHYDTRPPSVIRNILTAIGISDEIIGGSRSDRIL